MVTPLSSDIQPVRFDAIAEQGLCIGCGLCQAVAGPETIRMSVTPQGRLRPVPQHSLDSGLLDRIVDLCPGTRIDGLPAGELDEGTVSDPVWGPWRRAVTAWAGDAAVRHEGSTGGVLTALAAFALSSGRVGFVLHTRASADEPSFGEATISTSTDEVVAAAGSRYGPTDTLSGIFEALDRDEPFAFVGKPCDVAALRNLARTDDRVDRLVRYRLAMVCGGFGTPAFTRSFLDRVGIAEAELVELRYRGRGCPGPTVARTAERTVSTHYLDYWGDDESQWELPWRCKICPDGIGEAADLAASDTWDGGSPDRVASESDPGTNAVLTRTRAGDELLAAAVAAGALVVGEDVTMADMSRWQPHQVRKKQAVGSRYAGLGEAGRIVPRTERLRLDELTAGVPLEVRSAQLDGVAERIAAGKASEPTPVTLRPGPRGR